MLANERRKLKGVAKIKPKMCCCSVHVYLFDSTINHWNAFSLASAWQLLYMLNVRLIPHQVWPLLQFHWMFQKGAVLFNITLMFCWNICRLFMYKHILHTCTQIYKYVHVICINLCAFYIRGHVCVSVYSVHKCWYLFEFV